ncbi:MAG: TetR/AcrR family transcriptional regulator [Hahellaceae bacterium]|jgi:AcrR family transcriptional regulator|nr:TetR/AcrR family transcriptional regulator [Hahellaceae bacterium]MCP5210908.1 TetR/AcrR family transcriptional regulator [Hahellaceae bacterium]
MSNSQQSYHHGDLKRALLAEARNHLKTVGPEKISLRALARDLGVSQAAPYRHFTDKTHLLAALAAEGFSLLHDASKKALAGCDTSAQRLVAAGRAYVSFARQHSDLYRLMFGPTIPADCNYEALTEVGNRAFLAIISIVTEGISAGEFREEDPIVFANSAWAMVHGLASLLIDDRFSCTEHEFTMDELDKALAVIVEGIRANA